MYLNNQTKKAKVIMEEKIAIYVRKFKQNIC
jgi:hypothetical protein